MAVLTKLRESFIANDWYKPLQQYIDVRYRAIENRMLNIFNYVTPEESNRNTHSFEFSSILRDIGSIFTSTLSRLIKNSKRDYQENIYGYLKFIESFFPNIKDFPIDINFKVKTIIPLEKGSKNLPEWWHAYNDIKHDELIHYKKGNLENALKALAALKLLHVIITQRYDSKIFSEILVPVPREYITNDDLLFP